MTPHALAPGVVVQARPDPVSVGSEQRERRPALIISSRAHLEVVARLAIVLPCTTKYRQGWENHVRLDAPGLPAPTWAMTEQPRAISRERFVFDKTYGQVSDQCLAEVLDWVHQWIA